jgi:hypothetical protein
MIIVSSKSFFFFFIQLKEYQGHHFESRLEEDPITPFAAFIVILGILALIVTVFSYSIPTGDLNEKQ